MARAAAIALLLTLALTVLLGAADPDCASGCSLACLTCACCHVQGVVEGRIEMPPVLSSCPLHPPPPATLAVADPRGVLHVPKPA